MVSLDHYHFAVTTSTSVTLVVSLTKTIDFTVLLNLVTKPSSKVFKLFLLRNAFEYDISMKAKHKLQKVA